MEDGCLALPSQGTSIWCDDQSNMANGIQRPTWPLLFNVTGISQASPEKGET